MTTATYGWRPFSEVVAQVLASRGWQHRGDFWGRVAPGGAGLNPRPLLLPTHRDPKIKAASARSAHTHERFLPHDSDRAFESSGCRLARSAPR